jgi:hypothetical protein
MWTSIWIPKYPLRVETTRRQKAAYGHRTFNAGFLVLNPKGRPSQPDPKWKSAWANKLPESRRSTLTLHGGL